MIFSYFAIAILRGLLVQHDDVSTSNDVTTAPPFVLHRFICSGSSSRTVLAFPPDAVIPRANKQRESDTHGAFDALLRTLMEFVSIPSVRVGFVTTFFLFFVLPLLHHCEKLTCGPFIFVCDSISLSFIYFFFFYLSFSIS